jgi:hypothetical protein
MIIDCISNLVQMDRDTLSGKPPKLSEKKALVDTISRGVGKHAGVSLYVADLYLSNLISHRLRTHDDAVCFPEIEGDADKFPKLSKLRGESRSTAEEASKALSLFLSSNFKVGSV